MNIQWSIKYNIPHCNCQSQSAVVERCKICLALVGSKVTLTDWTFVLDNLARIHTVWYTATQKAPKKAKNNASNMSTSLVFSDCASFNVRMAHWTPQSARFWSYCYRSINKHCCGYLCWLWSRGLRRRYARLWNGMWLTTWSKSLRLWHWIRWLCLCSHWGIWHLLCSWWVWHLLPCRWVWQLCTGWWVRHLWRSSWV